MNAVSPLSFVKSTAPGNPYPGAAFQDSHTFRNRLKTGNVFPFPRIVNLKQYSVRQILLWKIPGGTSSLPTQYQQWRQCSHAPWAHKYKCLCRHSCDLKNKNATPQSKGTTRLQKPWLLKLAAIPTWGLSGECRSETKHAKPWAFALPEPRLFLILAPWHCALKMPKTSSANASFVAIFYSQVRNFDLAK